MRVRGVVFSISLMFVMRECVRRHVAATRWHLAQRRDGVVLLAVLWLICRWRNVASHVLLTNMTGVAYVGHSRCLCCGLLYFNDGRAWLIDDGVLTCRVVFVIQSCCLLWHFSGGWYVGIIKCCRLSPSDGTVMSIFGARW